MTHLSTIVRRAWAWFAIAGIVLFPAVAWAKEEAAPPAQGSSFMLSYILVILCIVLGVIAVVRSTKPRVEDSDQ